MRAPFVGRSCARRVATVGAVVAVVLSAAPAPVPAIASSAPDAPGTPEAVPREGSAIVAVPLSFSGTTATSLTVTADPGGATCTIDPAVAPRTCTVEGLDDGTAYTFTATATNGSGTSAASAASAAVTPRATYAILDEGSFGGFPNAIAIDAAGDFAYIAIDGYPGQVRKVRLSDLVTVATRTLQVSDQRPLSIVIDDASGFGYLGGAPSTTTAASPVTRFRLSDLARVDSVLLGFREAALQTAVIDPDGAYGYFSGYYGLNTTSVVKVDLANLSRIGSVSIAQSIPGVLNWDRVGAAAIDPTGTYAYFLSDTDPGAVFRIRLSDFTLQGRVVLSAESERYPSAAVVTPDGATLLVATGGWPGRIVSIDLDTFTRTGATTYTTEAPRGFEAAVLDPDGEHLYAVGDDPSWADTNPRILRIRLSDLAVVGDLVTDEFRSYRGIAIGSGGRELFAMSYQSSTARLLRVRIAEEDVGLPDAPGAATATAGVGEASVSWSAPSALGGFELVGYHIEQSTDGGAWASAGDGCAPSTTAVSTATTCTVTGLTKSVPVTFRVSAVGTAGAGSAGDATAAVTPTGVPDAPTGVAGTPGVRSAAVSWTAPADDGASALTGSTVTAAPGGATCTAAALATSCTVTGLADDTAYTFTVTATNAVGTGAASDASPTVRTPTVPGAPRAVAAVAGVRSAAVSWNAPASDGRDAVVSYLATANPGGRTCTATVPSTSCTVTGLADDTAYTFTVTATNGVGTGDASTASAAVETPGLPGAPTDVTVTRGDQEVAVSWTDPADDGGEDLATATVTASPGGRTCTAAAPATSCTVTGLTNGTSYTFTVVAETAVGTGPASDASAAVVPAGVPTAPTITGIDRGVGSLEVAFSAAATNGSALLRYEVALDGGAWATTEPGLPPGVVTLEGLTDDTAYAVALRAVNDVGAGAASTAVTATTAAVPGAPTGVTTTRGDEEVVVSWIAPSDVGGAPLLRSTATATPGGATCTATAPATSCTVTGLTNGTAYTFTVVAENAVGTGPSSDASSPASPVGLPLAPTLTAVRSGDRSLTVEFEAADGNGAEITGYEYRLGELDWVTPSVAVTASPFVISGLAVDAAYRVTIRAVSAAGSGAASEPLLGRTLPARVAEPRGPVLLPSGERPTLAPGARLATLGGRVVAPPQLVAGPGGFRLVVGATVLRLGPSEPGATVPGPSVGGWPVLVAGEVLPLAGDGFAPDSIVEVWLFSEPQLLALLRADATGLIDGGVPLDGWSTGTPIPEGRHTLQIGGVTADGELLGVSLGVTVVERVADVPAGTAGAAAGGDRSVVEPAPDAGMGRDADPVAGDAPEVDGPSARATTPGAEPETLAAPGQPVAEPSDSEGAAVRPAGGRAAAVVVLLAVGAGSVALLARGGRRGRRGRHRGALSADPC